MSRVRFSLLASLLLLVGVFCLSSPASAATSGNYQFDYAATACGSNPLSYTSELRYDLPNSTYGDPSALFPLVGCLSGQDSNYFLFNIGVGGFSGSCCGAPNSGSATVVYFPLTSTETTAQLLSSVESQNGQYEQLSGPPGSVVTAGWGYAGGQTLPSTVLGFCVSSFVNNIFGSSFATNGPWVIDCYSVGASVTPIPSGYPQCSVSTSTSTGYATVLFSDGLSPSVDSRTVSVTFGSASPVSLSKGVGSSTAVYSPIPQNPFLVTVKWSTGEVCNKTVSFFLNGTSGNPSGNGGVVVPSAWDPSSCYPTGWNLLDPVSYVVSTWCLFQASFIPTSADVSYLGAQVTSIPVVGSIETTISTITSIGSVTSNPFPTIGGFTFMGYTVPSATLSFSGFPVLLSFIEGVFGLGFLFVAVFDLFNSLEAE